MLLIQLIGLVSALPADTQILFIVCMFLLSMYLLTLIAFSRSMTSRLQQLIRTWQHTDRKPRKNSTDDSSLER